MVISMTVPSAVGSSAGDESSEAALEEVTLGEAALGAGVSSAAGASSPEHAARARVVVRARRS
jgi:hypothetical protein